MPMTQYTTNKMLEAAHGKTTYTAPANVYPGLSTTLPTVTGTNVTEPVGNGYARVAVPGSSFGAASGGSITNTAEITYPTATGPQGTVIAVPVFDALTGGNLLWFASVTSQSVVAGVTPSIAVGAATSTLS